MKKRTGKAFEDFLIGEKCWDSSISWSGSYFIEENKNLFSLPELNRKFSWWLMFIYFWRSVRTFEKQSRLTRIEDYFSPEKKSYFPENIFELIVYFYDFLVCWNKLSNEIIGGVMVKAMDCGIVVSEFVLQSRYYVHIRANTLGKGMNPLILTAMG